MTSLRAVTIDDVFTTANGKAIYIVDYVEAHPGIFPVYSASLSKPFGWIDTFDHDQDRLTWVLNGYGGTMQVVKGPFSANRDRGVLIPRPEFDRLDLDYARFAIEPALRAEAVGRRVDGLRNEYTKIYPPEARLVGFELPVTEDGDWDWDLMSEIGNRLRGMETATQRLEDAHHELQRAQLRLTPGEESAEVSLGDAGLFRLTIGERVLKQDRVDGGEVPIYSANVRDPFGYTDRTSINDFSEPSLLWGIDGIFDWNLMHAGVVFEHTDHCGRLQILSADLDPHYVYLALRSSREQYGFDRVYRSSLGNVRAAVTVRVPTDVDGRPSLAKQRQIAGEHQHLLDAQESGITAISSVMTARLAAASLAIQRSDGTRWAPPN